MRSTPRRIQHLLLTEERTGLQKESYAKFLHFINTTNYYRTERLYGILSSEGGAYFVDHCLG